MSGSGVYLLYSKQLPTERGQHMWAFFDFGLLMPALVPAKHKNDAEVLLWTNGGEYDLQVRGRLSEHLQYFMDNFMEDGTYNPVIQATPDKDYNFRFYTTVEAYAEGLKQAALKIDYEKYKESSDRYPWNKKFHSILTSIWAKLCDLNTPGGVWGPRSKDNPTGYTEATRYHGWESYDDDKWYEAWHNDRDRYYPTTFGNVQLGDDYPADWWENHGDIDDAAYDASLVNSGESYRNKQVKEIIEELDSIDIPMKDWWEYTSPREFYLLERTLRKHFNKKTVRSWSKKNKNLADARVAAFGTGSDPIEEAPLEHVEFHQTMAALKESVMQGIDKTEQKAVVFTPREISA